MDMSLPQGIIFDHYSNRYIDTCTGRQYHPSDTPPWVQGGYYPPNQQQQALSHYAENVGVLNPKETKKKTNKKLLLTIRK